MSTDIVIVAAARTAVGKFGGTLAKTPAPELGATVIKVNARRDPWWHATHIAYSCNRGKRSLGLDLKHPDGLACPQHIAIANTLVRARSRKVRRSMSPCT